MASSTLHANFSQLKNISSRNCSFQKSWFASILTSNRTIKNNILNNNANFYMVSPKNIVTILVTDSIVSHIL